MLKLIYPKRSVVVVLRRWAKEGRTVQNYQLNHVVRELRKYSRLKHAMEDFVDFGSIDWGRLLRNHGISDSEKVLIFFDDHQSELKRLKQALKAGFRHLIFEDNYDTGTCDHYFLRHIYDQSYIRGLWLVTLDSKCPWYNWSIMQ
uniref:Uncharacterized protein n=1 Tax=Zea mays TaxID=4577 RepID=A0A804R8Q0_MAIZE